MKQYGNYTLTVEPMPALRKNRLIFKRPVKWTSEDGRVQTSYDTVLTLEVAPLQEQLIMQALSLFENKEQKKKGKAS